MALRRPSKEETARNATLAEPLDEAVEK